MKYEGECIGNIEWVKLSENYEMGLGSLVIFVCRHNQNLFSWLVFDNIGIILKSEQKYYISKKWTNK